MALAWIDLARTLYLHSDSYSSVMPKPTFLDELIEGASIPKRLATARVDSFIRELTFEQHSEMQFPTWLGSRISKEGSPELLESPYEISWPTRVLDANEAQRFCEWVQARQLEHGYTVTGPCSWCGLPTGHFCEWCSSALGPEARLCSTCGWLLGQCRLCRMAHLSSGLQTIIPPTGSATCGTHRCGSCQRQGVHLKHCEGCCATRYCDRKCQKRDWSKHKLVCHFLASMVEPRQEQLHFVYSWHLSVIPSRIIRVPHGICKIALEVYVKTIHSEKTQTDVCNSSYSSIPPAASASRREQRETAKRLIQNAHFQMVNDCLYLGIPLTDGIGSIERELLMQTRVQGSA